MRYAQRDGYTPAEQQRRERLRLQAAGRFARGEGIKEIAHDLRVTEGSVRRWHRAWQAGGAEALWSRGPVSQEKLSPQQWARLELELRKGPLARQYFPYGWLVSHTKRRSVCGTGIEPDFPDVTVVRIWPL
jgi:putative transposase